MNSPASFPSGHSSWAFVVLGFIFLELRSYNITRVACVLLATFVAVSRVIDSKHFVTDCLAGSALGVGICYAVHRLMVVRYFYLVERDGFDADK